MRHCKRFGSDRENRRSCRLGSDESQDQDRHEHETEEEDEEKGDEKADTSNSETRRCVTVSANVGCARVLDRRSGSVAKTVNDSKAARHQLEELQRHDRAMEQSRRLYLDPYKHRQGVAAKKKKLQKRKKTIKMPSDATTNV